jgi:hypothetical protein
MRTVAMTPAKRQASAHMVASLVAGIRRYAAWMGRDVTADEQRRIEELERPPDRQRCAGLTLKEVTEALQRGRLRAASSAIELMNEKSDKSDCSGYNIAVRSTGDRKTEIPLG